MRNGGVKVKAAKYTSDGYLVVSELDSCPLWEKDSVPCCASCEHDCFYCAYAEFREDEFIESVCGKPPGEMLYSVCHNEKNRKLNEFI